MPHIETLDTTNNLVDIDEVMYFLGIADPAEERLTDLINEASIWFNNECDRQLKSRSQTEYHDYQYSPVLYLDHPPVSAVTLYTNSSIPRAYGTDDIIAADNYEIYTEDNIGKLVLTNATFDFGRRTIKVVYTGGFSTIPADLKSGVLNLIGQWYWLNKNNAFGVTAHDRPEGSGVTIDRDLPTQTVRAVARYRRNGWIV